MSNNHCYSRDVQIIKGYKKKVCKQIALPARFSAIKFYTFGSICCRTIAVPVDVAFEAFINNIHMTGTCENFIGTDIEVVCDALLQSLNLHSRWFTIRGNTVAVEFGKAFHDRV